MKRIHERPDWLKNFERPEGTEIKFINGHWYLYERFCVYDKIRHRKHKKSGKLLGTITPEGLRPPKRELQIIKHNSIVNLEYGASAFLFQAGKGMIEKLKQFFPGQWKEIFAFAVLKCQAQASFKQMDFLYSTSYLSVLLGELPLLPSQITLFLKDLGQQRESICNYMKSDIPDTGIIMFDGHRLISRSTSLEYARIGYDSKQRFLPQVNLLYLFGVNNGKQLPIFYKQYSGDVPDVSAFSDILEDAGLKNKEVIAITDKGFTSEENISLLNDSGIKYVMAVRRGCKEIGDLPEHFSLYEKAFTFRGRSIFCSERNMGDKNVFLYYDMELAGNETTDCIQRLNKRNDAAARLKEKEEKLRKKGKGKLSEEEFAALEPVDVAREVQSRHEIGTFALETNCKEYNCAQVFYIYKTRQEIEQSFKSFDDTLDASASYMRNQYAFEAWLFINHLALQLLYSCLGIIADAGMTDQYAFEDLMHFLKGVRINLINRQWMTTKITKQTEKCCKALGITLPIPESMGTP